MDLDGKEKSRAFSVNKYGEQGAFVLACKARLSAIKGLIANGAEYTERHTMIEKIEKAIETTLAHMLRWEGDKLEVKPLLDKLGVEYE